MTAIVDSDGTEIRAHVTVVKGECGYGARELGYKFLEALSEEAW
jgi:hypothetical protein